MPVARNCKCRLGISCQIRPCQCWSWLVISARLFYNLERFREESSGPGCWVGEEVFGATLCLDRATAVSEVRRLLSGRKERPSGEVVLAPDGIEDTLGRVSLASPFILANVFPFLQYLRV